MSTSEEKYISLRRLNDFKTLLEDEYKIDKHTNQIGSLLDRGAKNLLKITATPQTISGVTFTVNEDQTVTVNGTATATAVFNLYIISASTSTEYMNHVLSGCPAGGSESTYRLVFQRNSGYYTTFASDTGNGAVIENFTATECRVAIVVYSGTSVSNIIFKPMICTVEDYAISPDFVPHAKSNYELTKYVGPVPRLVDTGAKNIASIGAVPNRSDLNIQVSDTHVSISGTLTSQFTWNVAEFGNYVCKTDMIVPGASTSTNITYSCYYTDKAGTARYITIPTNGILTIPAGSTIHYLYFQQRTSGTSVSIEADVMLCTAEDYAISPEIVPYAPTNRELYLNQQKSFGKLVYQTVHNSSYTSTYSMKTSDFGDGPAGLYMIYIISWATSPTISVYAMAYSGGVVSQSKLAKVFGTDANISLTGDTVTYTGAGKIQIVAMHTL